MCNPPNQPDESAVYNPNMDAVDDGYVLSLPYNPNVVGRLRRPPQDSASLTDHLAPRKEQERGTNAHGFYKNLVEQRNRLPPGNKPKAKDHEPPTPPKYGSLPPEKTPTLNQKPESPQKSPNIK